MTPPPVPPSGQNATPNPPPTGAGTHNGPEGIGDRFRLLLGQPERFGRSLENSGSSSPMTALLATALLGAVLYGLVVGSFSGGVQWWAAPLKIAAGLSLSAILCLPSLYVFSCLTGQEIRIRDLSSVVAGMLALDVVLLASLAPIAWIFSQSTSSVAAMGFIHLVLWFVASGFGFRLLTRALPGAPGRNNPALNVWCALFLLVSLQMMTTLRPLVGTAETLLPTEKRFFMQHWGKTMSESE